MKHIYYICNLQAGKAELSANLGTVIDLMTKAGYEVTVHPTQAPMDAVHRTTEAARSGKYDHIFCSGGDGTLNEVMNGMMHSGTQIPLGYIPCGSVNDFARSIGIPREIPKAAEMVLSGVSRRFDMGTVNDRTFNYIAAFGAFTDVTYETKQSVKNVFGPVAYILNAATKIANIRPYPMRITCDGQVFEDSFIFGMITNSASVGGVLDISDFLFDDGAFEITLLKQQDTLPDLRKMLSFLRDIHEIGENDKIICLRASDITVELLQDANVPWTVDGEYMQNTSHFHIVNHKQAVSLLVPREYAGGCFTQ